MKIHFMGVKGSGMSGVARLAKKMGYEVTGCDLEADGHSVDHLKGVDLLVVTPAVFWQSANHPELIEGQKRGIVMTWQGFLGKVLLLSKKVIAVAGTHGKSTTTAMVSKLLTDIGYDPICVIGAYVPEWKGNSRFGRGEWAVVEADEFNDNFLNYHPEIAIVTNIEFDHPDFFKNEKHVQESFGKFVKQSKSVIAETSPIRRFNLKVLGEHNQMNANLVYKLGRRLGISDRSIIKSIESFRGIGRRMELIGKVGKTLIYDDYAHHPTAIKTTLEGLREKYPKARILAIIEPHGYKRTKALLPKYKGAFDRVDKVIIGPIFKARDSETYGITPQSIAVAANHPDIRTLEGAVEPLQLSDLKSRDFDIVIVMGAGKSNLWAREIADTIDGSTQKSFKELTSFNIGGEIAFFYEVKTRNEVVGAVKFAKSKNLPIFVLGDGTDILVSDEKFAGVVIKYSGDSIQRTGNRVKAEAGVNWDDLVKYAVESNLLGIECLSGIPGTVGAAPIQNIGAYGQELKDTFVSLTAYDIKREEFVTFKYSDCEFGYRESIFKKPDHWQKYVITDITLELKPYKDNELELQTIRDEILRVRSEKLPDPKVFPNAGSFFKNPIITAKKKEELVKKFPDAKIFTFGKYYKISAGWMIEKAGWKGKAYKNVSVSPKHALVIINRTGKAKGEEIIELSEKIKDDIRKKFGISLELEVQLINFPQKIAIVGYGIEGQDAEKYYLRQGIKPVILDHKFDKNYLDDLNGYDLIVRSAGVNPDKKEIKEAKNRGARITTPIQIFFDNCKGKIIGITGTKGKGTTASLIYEILKKAGKEVFLAGNIGKPYLELLPVITKKSFVVLELSSFQLIDIKSSPDIAVVLNITSDHMDWHKSQKEYIDAKRNITNFQTKNETVIINGEYEIPRSIAKESKAKIVYFSKKTLEKKYKEKLLLRGEHNWENIAAAFEVSKLLKINPQTVLTTVRKFKGLEHRLEMVKIIRGRTFYNDSFATGPQPTIAAIKSFHEDITIILGGSEKGLSFEDLGKEISKANNIKNIILIGEIREKINKEIKKYGYKGKIYDLGKPLMKDIVKKAYEVTKEGGVILLSPASASFDMFTDYKDRGNQFKKEVDLIKV